MDYELKKSKREKSSIVPIEEVYTDLDIKENDPYEPSIGYRFDTPRRWAQDKSKNKSIGIRDLKLTPSSGDIRCRFLTYAHVGYTTRHYVWNTNHYEKSGDDTFRDFNFNTAASGAAIPLKFWAVSNAINYSITPQNNFEEILTDMINQINDATWKGVSINHHRCSTIPNGTHQKGRGPLYVDENDDSVLDYVLNYNCLKIPMTFYYHYDSSACNFNVKNVRNLRLIRMLHSSHSKPSNEPDEYFYRWEQSDIPNAYNSYTIQYIEDNNETQLTDEGTPITELYAYDPQPTIRGVELLMIVDVIDEDSLRAIYNFFNQPLHDEDYDDLAMIEVDGKDYYVPFMKNTGGTTSFNFIDGKNQPYLSSFPRYTSARHASYRTRTDITGMITNLNLNNVWDRIHLIYHASFAETRTRMIGRNNDHWDSPNKRFIVPGSDQDEFYLRFTTDGKHSILPIGCHFNVDLCFMLNTSNNLATGTGNHDMFK